jgi:hypothetical protein
MPNNSPPPDPTDLNPVAIRQILSELHEFKQTRLYKLYTSHFQILYDDTVTQILEERLKGPETLYTREAWIGEARAADLNRHWFDITQDDLSKALTELDNEA